jgi:UDP-N-acetylglucosamine--N-acetylmuramyl-(pentapeptide) pyrophosphoryl-undecaprenol N-acetylglucosamine transferase
MDKKIMIMAGGTGGHVFPALAVAENLREKGWTVTWLGTERGLENRVVPAKGFELDYLSVAGLRGKGLFFKLKSVLLLFKACWQARRHLKKRQPNVVLGMGGFASGPGGLMAKLLGIPLVIHEQNRVVGTTNRLLAKLANQVLEGFPDSFPPTKKATFTGNPLRADFLNLPEKTAWQACERALNILIVGGSQGAQILNQTVPAAIEILKSELNVESIEIKHQTGEAMFEEVEAVYEKINVAVDVLKFIENMPQAYQWADLVVCRSGAMTVSEVAAAGLPAIFVPLPHAIDDHQTANARYLTDADAGIMMLQKELTSSKLADVIKQNLTKFNQMGIAAKNKARLDATEAVAQICIREAGA